jgi:hypothetical protein
MKSRITGTRTLRRGWICRREASGTQLCQQHTVRQVLRLWISFLTARTWSPWFHQSSAICHSGTVHAWKLKCDFPMIPNSKCRWSSYIHIYTQNIIALAFYLDCVCWDSELTSMCSGGFYSVLLLCLFKRVFKILFLSTLGSDMILQIVHS